MGARVSITCCSIIVVWLWTASASAAGSPAALVDGMMDFYDMHADERLTENERAWIRWGAEHEGLQLRQLQHSRVATRDRTIPNAIPVVSARQWIHDTSVQSNAAFQGNYTWEQAIADAKNGDRQRGYEALGHIVRVLEDASIPHMGATFNTSPYWRWMRAQSAETTETVTRSMRRTGGRPERLASIDAAYDTIVSSVAFLFGGSLPENGLPTTANDLRIETSGGIRRVYAIARGDDDQSVRVARWKGFNNEWTMADPIVLLDVWQRLAPVAIRSGASVIQLYREEVETTRVASGDRTERRWWDASRDVIGRVAQRVGTNASRDVRTARRVLARVFEFVPSFSPHGVEARPEPVIAVAALNTPPPLLPTPAFAPLALAVSVPIPLPFAESVPTPELYNSVMENPSMSDVRTEAPLMEEVVVRADASVENIVETPIFEVPASSVVAAPPVDIQGFPIGYMPSPRAPVVAPEPPAPQPPAETPPADESVPEPPTETPQDGDPGEEPPPEPEPEPPPAPPAEEPPPTEPPSPPPPPPLPPSPAVIEITQVNYQGGAAAENIVLSNTGGQDQALLGWSLSDAAATPHTYSFGAVTLAAGASVTIRTGKGTDTATDVYWNRGSGVWNDGGDTAFLKNELGTLIDSVSW